MRCLLASLYGFSILSAAFGQSSTGVILLNVRDEHTSCITSYDDAYSNHTCGSTDGVQLGRTIRLLVLNRHYMTKYSLEIGESASTTIPRLHGGPLRTVPLPSEVPVAGLSPPRVEPKATRDFLSELLDVTSSSESVEEINREKQVLDRELAQIRMDISAFNRKYALVVNDGAVTYCDPTTGQRNGARLHACLNGEFDALQVWNPPDAATGERNFRDHVGIVDSLFEDVKNFGVELSAADLASQGRAIESAIDGYEVDLQSFQANLHAAQEAVWIVKNIQDAHGDPLLSLQIRAELRKRLNGTDAMTGTAKSALDETETNEQIDRYFRLLRNSQSIPQQTRNELQGKISDFSKADWGLASLDAAQEILRNTIDNDLPTLVTRINDGQRRLAARVNKIYQDSEMPIAESDSGLSQISPDGIVNYRILRINEFEPYAFSRSETSQLSLTSLEVTRGAFAVTDTRQVRKRTVWQILRLVH